jgi:hypothetical protein
LLPAQTASKNVEKRLPSSPNIGRWPKALKRREPRRRDEGVHGRLPTAATASPVSQGVLAAVIRELISVRAAATAGSGLER